MDPSTQTQTPPIEPALRRGAARANENFSVLSPLLPRDLVDDFAAVYAFCRRADDLADDAEPTDAGRAEALRALGSFRAALDDHLAGEPPADRSPHPDDPMLARLAVTIRARGVHHEHFHRLLDAFERDQTQRRYETWEDLLSYCAGSADPVGRIVLELGGLDTGSDEHAQIVGWSDTVCSALQLTNHWQDVHRDLLERDRVYLPIDETGLSADDLHAMIASPRDPEHRIRYIRALRPLVERTRAMYASARPLPRALAKTEASRIAPTVWLLGAGGEATLRRIERLGCTTLWRRPRLGRATKSVLVMGAAIGKIRFR